MEDIQKYINALRKCAEEHKNDRTSVGYIIVSDLCKDTAKLLEALEQETCKDAISVDQVIEFLNPESDYVFYDDVHGFCINTQDVLDHLCAMPSAQSEQEDYAELKQEFLRMASYIDCLLECSDEQKETLIGFISRLAEYMPWTEKD